ncbi:MAG: histone deacetylase family protein [Oscillochloris sp.]|nr:histone deacetylase family protein [Oscillochloris sp.]
MQIIDSPAQIQHDPPFEIVDGQLTPYFETPRRAIIIAEALAKAGFPTPLSPRTFGIAPILAVHTAAYVAYLEHTYVRWVAAGRSPTGVIPSTLPLGGMRGHSSAPTAEAGRYCFDLSAPIVAGTYTAARSAADAALTGATLLLEGARAAYALCRPPGHHAMPALAGGSCYLNNGAIAAHHLASAIRQPDVEIDRQPWVMAPASVAILDIDYHHGNGTQTIFYDRNDVFFASIHADPDREYPYFLGFADERGAGAGEGYTLNLPLEAGIDDTRYRATLEQALEDIAAYNPRFLVVSAGFDTFAGDPLGDFALSAAAYPVIGQRIAQLGLPTLFVQEGGYATDNLGTNVVGLLQGFEA